jgi:hypothetical protein
MLGRIIARTGTASCMPRGQQRQFSRSDKVGQPNSGRLVAVPQEIEATLKGRLRALWPFGNPAASRSLVLMLLSARAARR